MINWVFLLSYGVIGNTSGFGPEESRFEPLWDNNIVESSNGRIPDFESGRCRFDPCLHNKNE
jgi:hypothetical protein